MNEKLQEAIANIVEKALNTADAAEEFVMAEMPDVAEQLLTWNFTLSLIWFVIGILLLTVALPLLIRTCIKTRSEEVEIFAFIAAAVSCAGGVIATFINLTWIKIAVAPKMRLIEYAANLIK